MPDEYDTHDLEDDEVAGFEPLPDPVDDELLDEAEEADETAKAPLINQPEGWQAAVCAGIGVGLVMDVLVEIGIRGCGWLGHAGVCGTGPGLGLLAVFFVVGVVSGAWLLKQWGASDTGTTSFLSLGLVGVISLLFLSGSLDGWPALIYIPVLSAVTMLISWLVTNVVAVSVDTFEE